MIPIETLVANIMCVTRAMQDVMKLVRVASDRHLRNWEAPDALVQEITPSGELNG